MEYRTIEEWCEILDSQRIPITAKDRVDGPYPYYGANGIQDYVNDYIFDDELVLLAEDGGNFGSKDRPIAYRVSGKCWVNNHAHVLKAKNGLDVDYLCYSLMFYNTNGLVNGATRQKLTQSTMRKMKIPYLEINKQREIVQKIKKIESVLNDSNRQLDLLDELIKARFVEMFGDPVHSEKYGTRKLSSCIAEKSDMVDGPFGSQVNTKVDYIENGEIPVIRTVNVKMMSFSPTDLKYMTREKYETVIRSQVLPGDVILTKVGTIGNVCIFPNAFDEAVLSTTGSCRIRVDNSVVNTQFFAYNLMYLKGKLLEIASAGVQPFLNMNHVKNIDILDVSLEKQKEFADFVKEVDKSRSRIQKSLEASQELFDSLMQEYFG